MAELIRSPGPGQELLTLALGARWAVRGLLGVAHVPRPGWGAASSSRSPWQSPGNALGWGSEQPPGPGHSRSALLCSQLRKEYGANVVPAFPPKKIFTLTPAEVEQRREQLEKYMQAGKPALPCARLTPRGQRRDAGDRGALSRYWDSSYDDDVMEHRVGLNLLYVQTVSDIEHGWILVNKDQHRQLKSLQEKVSKKEFIRLAQTLKYYGYLKFDPCVTDFPEKGCHVVVSAGNNELNFQVRLPNEQIKEGSFKVTRMRCWRVTSSVPMSNGPSGSSPGKSEVKLELAFEYLMSKDRLQWVTITSPQAIMLSICLQSMVDELMVKKSGGSISKMFRRPQSKLTSVSLRGISHCSSASDVGANDFHGNYAFEGIGDEDL
nr:sorting nexin-17 [Columba livia]